MATVNIFYLDQVVVDANGRNTFGYADRTIDRVNQVIPNGTNAEFTAPASSVYVIIETDADCRYEVKGAGIANYTVDPPDATSPPIKGDPFLLQGPIQLRTGWSIKITAFG